MDASVKSKTTYVVTDEVVCVLGSGNALKNMNARYRVEGARRRVMDLNGHPIIVAFYGCHMPRMTDTPDTEAQTMRKLWETLDSTKTWITTNPRYQFVLHDDPDMNCVSAECAAIVQDYLAHGDRVHLVINWPHMPRTYFLLWHHAKQQKLDWLKYRENVRLVHNVPSAGLLHALFYELCAWSVNLLRIARKSFRKTIRN